METRYFELESEFYAFFKSVINILQRKFYLSDYVRREWSGIFKAVSEPGTHCFTPNQLMIIIQLHPLGCMFGFSHIGWINIDQFHEKSDAVPVLVTYRLANISPVRVTFSPKTSASKMITSGRRVQSADRTSCNPWV